MPKQTVKTVKKNGHKQPKKRPQAAKTAAAVVDTASTDTPATGQRSALPSVFQLTKTSFGLLWRYKELFLAITLIYGVLNIMLVRGFASGTDVSELKRELSSVFSGNFGSLASGLSVFVVLVGSSGNSSSQTAGAYQLFLGLIVSLAVIWALRYTMAGKLVRARDAFYQGMYPLVPFILVLLTIAIQLIPLLIGALLYSTVIGNSIAVSDIEKILWFGLFAVLAAVSIYFVTASIFALYIVSLPNTEPRKALKAARELVKGRRLLVLRKALFLPLLLFIAAAVIVVPIIIIITPLAQWIFFVLTMFGLVASHAYMYTLYRELLNE